MSGRIHKLFIKPGHGQPMRPVEAVEAVTGQGLLGDASYGRSKRQVLVIERETLLRFGLEPGQVRENMTISDLSLADLPAGAQIQAGDVLLEVTGDCAPCHFLDDIRQGLQEAMQGQRGVLCRVSGSGTIRLDDEVRLIAADLA